MPNTLHEERRNYWFEKIKEHTKSNLSVIAFCKNKDINYRNFYRWRKVLKNDSLNINEQNSFIEIQSKPSDFEFEIKSKKHIFKFKNPDFTFIKSFMTILKGF